MRTGRLELSLSLERKYQGEPRCYVITSKTRISNYVKLVFCCAVLQIELLHKQRAPTNGGHCHDQDTKKPSEGPSGLSDAPT
jgi:hypothetical protein